MKATAAHRAHFARIAAASDALERERCAEAARVSPAEKLEEALRLSNTLLRDGDAGLARTEHPSFSLIARWRARKAQQSDSGRT